MYKELEGINLVQNELSHHFVMLCCYDLLLLPMVEIFLKLPF